MRHLAHLVVRFFRSLRSRRPGIDDQQLIARHLTENEALVFWRQPIPDLDHCVRGARHIMSVAPARHELVRAFLLHDIGKRHAHLGTIRRSITTALDLVGLPVGSRGRAYLDHAAVGADELEQMGCEVMVIAFAAHHHHARPSDVPEADWVVLVSADRR